MGTPTEWRCNVCGYVHTGPEPPAVCPVCGVGPELFAAVARTDEAPAPAAEQKWRCNVCGYMHTGKAPPDPCPVCGVGPEMFAAPDTQEETPAPPTEQSSGEVDWRCEVCGYVHRGATPPERCPVCGVGPEMFTKMQAVAKHGRGAASVDSFTGHVVVIGAGIAGVQAAAAARETASAATVTLVSAEPAPPYLRINLTRVLAGEVDEESLALNPPEWYAERRIDLVEATVEEVDTDEREVALNDGRRLSYDRLVVTTGANPFVPPIPGAKLGGVFSLRTRDDARTLVERTNSGTRCVCIGGGLLGLETAGGLARRGATVTVLEGAPHLLPRQLAEPAAALLRQHVESAGITVRCDVRVTAVEGDEQASAVVVDGSDRLPADIVVLATGVRPNLRLAKEMGLKVARGIVVDDEMATSNEGIYAAGDAAEHHGTLYGIWPAAHAQGAVAGQNAAGGAATFTGIPPSTRLKVLDVDVFSVGDVSPDEDAVVVAHEDAEGYVHIVCRDGRVVGANLIGRADLATELSAAIEKKTPLSELTELRETLPELGDAQDP